MTTTTTEGIILLFLYLFFAPHKVKEHEEILPDIWGKKIDSIRKEKIKDLKKSYIRV